ncbi:MAG: protein-glutamate O-methyltransferase CheR [Gammaproteobacteria bacterium]|nr:protein-glutamate O-methyltransferase CheR [Gammaproteobacteria bacterium]
MLDFEVDLIIMAADRGLGIDLSGYARASLTRRLSIVVEKKGLENLSEMVPLLLHNAVFQAEFVSLVMVPVSELFRDPGMFLTLKNEVFPQLESYHTLHIWVAGCAYGQEAYSLAILLDEAGLLERTTIYATDISKPVLDVAKSGILTQDLCKETALLYQASGGLASLSDYFTSAYGKFKLKGYLLEKIHFAQHDLVKGAAFTSAQLVLCRNVFIYFNEGLQESVMEVLMQSIVKRGFFVIGPKETIKRSNYRNSLMEIDRVNNVFRKR